VSPAMMVKSLPEIASVEPPLSVYLGEVLEESGDQQNYKICLRVE